MKKAGVLLADGFEEIEAFAAIDILRRAELEVIIYGLDKEIIVGAHQVRTVVDKKLADWEDNLDALILPGGMVGAKNIAASEIVKEWIQKIYARGKIIAAICASPALVLAPLGILDGRKATCYPGMQESFNKSITYLQEKVVIDENIITSRGPATALEFSLAIVEKLLGKDTADVLRRKILA